MKKEIAKIIKERLDRCRASGNFSPAEFGKDFGMTLEIEGGRAVATFSPFTPEGALLLTELANTRFFEAAIRG